jgi:replication initiator protein RepSA
LTDRKSTQDLVKDIQQAGGCSHPIRLRGEFVNVATGEVNARPLLIACKDRRAVVCAACSYLYKADAWIVVSTGLIGGKGVPASISDHPRLFLTLTAPSFGTVHAREGDGSCQPGPLRFCHHGRSRTCSRRHDDADAEIGSPLCDLCYSYVDAVLWNAESSRLWNRTFEQIRRRLAVTLGVTFEDLSQHVRLNYLKVAEFQRRGLAHFHVVLRLDGPGESFSPPPTDLTAQHLASIIESVVKDFDVTGPRGTVSWGRQFRVADASTLNRDDLRIAAYLAKYATKSADGSLDFARRFGSRSEILNLNAPAHLQQLALTSWDLARDPFVAKLNTRGHAHAFGFRGQLITKSRHYSTRFGDLRDARAAHMKLPHSDDPISGSFVYDGRGYDDPRAATIAEFLHQLTLEARKSVAAETPSTKAAE